MGVTGRVDYVQGRMSRGVYIFVMYVQGITWWPRLMTSRGVLRQNYPNDCHRGYRLVDNVKGRDSIPTIIYEVW